MQHCADGVMTVCGNVSMYSQLKKRQQAMSAGAIRLNSDTVGAAAAAAVQPRSALAPGINGSSINDSGMTSTAPAVKQVYMPLNCSHLNSRRCRYCE
jgi:hypothetical protein